MTTDRRDVFTDSPPFEPEQEYGEKDQIDTSEQNQEDREKPTKQGVRPRQRQQDEKTDQYQVQEQALVQRTTPRRHFPTPDEPQTAPAETQADRQQEQWKQLMAAWN